MVIYRQPFNGEYPITQRYGEVIEGVTYKGQPHTGIDYGCPEGTPILASADGLVKFAEMDNTGYGNTVIIEHYDTKATLYAHLSAIKVVVNQIVFQGDVIGYSGSSGNVTGPHLHFEARAKWCDWRSHRDPVSFLPLMSVDDKGKQLKNAESFDAGDTVCVSAPLGAKAYFQGFHDFTVYPMGTKFHYTGQTEQRNGYTYMQVIPLTLPLWIAVNDGETQILEAT